MGLGCLPERPALARPTAWPVGNTANALDHPRRTRPQGTALPRAPQLLNPLKNSV